MKYTLSQWLYLNNITQLQIAKHLGFKNRSIINEFVNGRVKWKKKKHHIEKLCTFLKCTEEELFYGFEMDRWNSPKR